MPMMPGMTAAGSPGQPGVNKASKKVRVTSCLVQCTDPVEQNFSFTHHYNNHESATPSALLKVALLDPSMWSLEGAFHASGM